MAVCLKGIRTFRILCKQAKHCGDNEDVARIVRDFLIVSVSQMSVFFWRSMPNMPTSHCFRRTIHAAGCWVDSASLRHEFDPDDEIYIHDFDYLQVAHELSLCTMLSRPCYRPGRGAREARPFY